jgi:GTPase SAR1 family protein
MKRSILLMGPKGSGKTAKMEQILRWQCPELLNPVNPENTIHLSFKQFKSTAKVHLLRYDAIAIDDIWRPAQVEYLIKMIDRYSFALVVATQLHFRDLVPLDLSRFNHVLLMPDARPASEKQWMYFHKAIEKQKQ